MSIENLATRHSTSTPESSRQNFRAAIDRTAAASIAPIMFTMSVVFAVSTVSHIVIFDGAIRNTLGSMAALLTIACLVLGQLAHRKKLTDLKIHFLGACFATCTLAYLFTEIALDPQPVHSFNISLFLIGIGVFLLSRLYMIALTLAAIIGWSILAWTSEPQSQWFDYAFFHLIGTGIGVAYFIIRRRSIWEIEHLTSKRNAQKKSIQESETRFRKLVHNSTDIITLLNASGEITYESDAALIIFGQAKDTLTHSLLLNAIHDDDKNNFTQTLTALLQSPDQTQDFAFRRETISGDWRFIEAVAVNLLTDPQVAGIVINSRDVTERKRVARALGPHQHYASLAHENTHVGSWEWDVDTGKVSGSAELLDIHGVTPDEFDGTMDFILNLVHPDDLHILTHYMDVNAQKGQVYPIEYRIARPDGEERTLWADGEFLLDAKHKPTRMIVTVQDITDLKIAELELKRLEDELRQTQKLEAVGTLAEGIAHDFNNYLTAISGYLDLSLLSLPDEHEAVTALNQAGEAAIQAGSVVAALQTFSKHRSVEKVPINLTAKLKQTNKILRKLLPSSIEIIEKLPEQPVWVRADANQLAQVWLNLALNARDAMPQAGTITIQLEHTITNESADTANNVPINTDERAKSDIDTDASAHEDAELVFNQELGAAHITFTDTGCGMPAKLVEHAFEPFFTTKPRDERSGLGLAITHGIITDHLGNIAIESVLDKGTCFNITIPCCLPSDSALVSNGAKSKTPGRGETVLLAADNDLVRAVITTHLQEAGYTIQAVADSQHAVNYFTNHKDEVSLAILDLELPKALGATFIESMRQIKSDLPIIIATENSRDQSKDLEQDNVTVLSKPFQLGMLVSTIVRILESESPEPKQVQAAPLESVNTK
jgi:two-component system, cell cycle sensor histidine kinase and response regulator CckA